MANRGSCNNEWHQAQVSETSVRAKPEARSYQNTRSRDELKWLMELRAG